MSRKTLQFFQRLDGTLGYKVLIMLLGLQQQINLAKIDALNEEVTHLRKLAELDQVADAQLIDRLFDLDVNKLKKLNVDWV